MQKTKIFFDKLASEQVLNRDDLANFLKISPKYLNCILYSKNRGRYYHEKSIKKATPKGEKDRILHAVRGELKYLQRRALDTFQSIKDYKPSIYSHGFTPDKSIITNAAYHRRSKLIIKVDLQDFFPNIHFGRVQGMFMAQPFNFGKEAATTMAQMACLPEDVGIPGKEGSLPQGGVLSPYISNMLCRRLDKRLARLANVNQCHFTRYADDMTFSTNDIRKLDTRKFLEDVYKIIESEHFNVNEDKTKMLTRKNRQIVTGIVVNDGLNVNRKYIRNLRATIRNCERFKITTQVVKKGGFDDPRNSRIAQCDDSDSSEIYFLRHLVGKLNFFRDVVLHNIMVKDKDGLLVHYVDRDQKQTYDIDPASFKRLQTHAKLTIRLYRLVAKQGKYKDLEKVLANNGKKNPYCSMMNLFARKSEIIKSVYDEYKKDHPELKRLHDISPDAEKTREMLQSLRNSVDGLGLLTHFDAEFTFKRGMECILNEYYPRKYFLPDGLLKTFNIYIDKFEHLGLEYGESQNIDVFNDVKITDSTKKLKRDTRFDPNEKSLKSLLKACVENAKKQHNVKKDIQIEYINIGDEQFYTHVPSIKVALEQIIHSMFKNTKGDTVYIETSLNAAKEVLILKIRDNSRCACFFNGGNGKLKNAIKKTKYLCEFWIEYTGEDNARKCYDMHTEKHIDVFPFQKDVGFVHILQFYVESTQDKDSDKNSTDEAGTSYKVLLLDNQEERRNGFEKNIAKINNFSIEAFASIDQKKFEQKRYSIAFIHKSNIESPYIQKNWDTVGVKLIFFSGNIDREFNPVSENENMWEISISIITQATQGNVGKLKKLLRRMGINPK